MKKFVIKTLIFMISIPIMCTAVYTSIDFYYNSKSAENSLFIWGDSQTMRGIDLAVLKDKTNKTIYSAARHGAGVYDFLVFVDKVPANSDVLIGISKLVQIRRKEMDRNLSGISLSALKSLQENNYSWDEIFQIIKKNRKQKKLFLTNTNMFEYADSIVIGQPIQRFENLYKSVPSYLAEKQSLYMEGIKKLKNKNCRINLIDFPYHNLLQGIENDSPIKKHTDAFFEKIQIEADCESLDSLNIKVDKQVMHDLTHLNCYGAEQVSLFIGEKIKKHKRTAFCITNGK